MHMYLMVRPLGYQQLPCAKMLLLWPVHFCEELGDSPTSIQDSKRSSKLAFRVSIGTAHQKNRPWPLSTGARCNFGLYLRLDE